MPMKSWTIGIKDIMDYTDATVSITMFRGCANHDELNMYLPWSGKHQYLITDKNKENPTYSIAKYSYGSGDYNRPASLESLYLVKY